MEVFLRCLTVDAASVCVRGVANVLPMARIDGEDAHRASRNAAQSLGGRYGARVRRAVSTAIVTVKTVTVTVAKG